jgi:hypothetical protein
VAPRWKRRSVSGTALTLGNFEMKIRSEVRWSDLRWTPQRRM